MTMRAVMRTTVMTVEVTLMRCIAVTKNNRGNINFVQDMRNFLENKTQTLLLLYFTYY